MSNRKTLDSRLGWTFGKVAGNKTRRHRTQSPRQVFDHLEDRCLMAVTTTQGLPVVAVEGATFSGVVAEFTSNDAPQPLSNFTANIVWGDGNTTIAASIVNDSVLTGVFDVLGSNTYAEEGTYAVSVSIVDAPPAGVPSSAVAASVATVSDAALAATGIPTPPKLPEGQIVAGVPTFSGTVATFTDADPAGTVTDYTATITWGDGVNTNGVVSGPVAGVFSVTGAHTFEEGSYPVSVLIQDSGRAKATAVTTFTITDPSPVVAPIAPAALFQTEGQAFTAPIGAFTDPNLIATTSDFAVTITWGDTTTSTGTVSQGNDGTFVVTGSHTYAEENAAGYPVTFTVKDVGGGTLTKAAGVTIIVFDAPLNAEGIELAAVEGSALSIPASTVVATFTDANPAGTATDYGTTIYWGDGMFESGVVVPIAGVASTFNVTTAAGHTYTEEGKFNVRVTIGDVGAAFATAGSTATVSDAPLTAVGTAQGATVITEGTPTTIQVASFADADLTNTVADPLATPSDYSAVIYWGDGISSPGTIAFNGLTGFNVTGTHTYEEGTFPVRVVITDVGGGATATATTTLTAGDATLTAAATPPLTQTEGVPFTAQVGAFTDANPLGTVSDFAATITWGDTTTSSGTVSQLASGTFVVTGSHTYAEDTTGALPYAITYTVKDVGGFTLTDAAGAKATVNDAPLSSLGALIQATEGVPFASTLVATVTDSNPGATVADFTTGTGSVTINWGDGSTSTLTSVPPVVITSSGSPAGVVFSISGAHAYLEAGSYQITVTATDKGGATTIANAEADVADAPLSAGLPQPAVAQDEPTIFPLPVFAPPLFSGPVAYFIDVNPMPPTGSSTIADFTATIDWGDGTPHTTGTIGTAVVGGGGGIPGLTVYSVSGSHTYADSTVNGSPGHPTIQVLVTDDDGSQLTVKNTNVSVADNSIKLAGILNPGSDSGSSNSDHITKVNQPDFVGTSEAFSHVSLFATATGGGPVTPIGLVQAGSDGSWNIKSTVALADGSYTITATAVDQFGVTTTPAPVTITSNLVIDTVGPVITGMFFNRLNGEVDFTIKDPNPASGIWVNTILDAANYQLTKVHANKAYPGKWIVTNVSETPVAAPDSYNVAVTFNSGKALRGGFYLFTIRDSTSGKSSVQDIAGNHLDGEFYGSFPSGNGIPGGDFVAELSGYHNKIFAPQTIVGTANAANHGVGGPPVGAVHSGNFTPIVPVGGGSVFVRDPKHLRGTRAKTVVKSHTVAKAVSHPVQKTKVHDAAIHALAAQTKSGRLYH